MDRKTGHLDLSLLRTFVSVVDLGGFAKAATALDLAPPTVSLQMKRLAEQVGLPVFANDGRGKSLTRAGHEFLPQARKLLQLNDRALTQFQDRSFNGTLRIGTSQDFAEAPFLHMLKRFEQAYPNVAFQLTVDLNRKIHQAFAAGKLDIAIAARDPWHPNGGQLIRQTPLLWIGEAASLRDTERALPLVLFQPPCIVRDLVERTLATAGIDWRLACCSPSLEGLLLAARAGLGLTARTPQHLGEGLVDVGEKLGLPPLPMLDIALYTNPANRAVTALAENIVLDVSQLLSSH